MNRKQQRIGKQRRQRECGIDVTQSYIRLLCGVTTTINPSQVSAAIWAVRVSMGMTQQPVMVRFACISVLALSLLTLSTHTGLIVHSPMAYARDPCDMVFSLDGPTFSGTCVACSRCTTIPNLAEHSSRPSTRLHNELI